MKRIKELPKIVKIMECYELDKNCKWIPQEQEMDVLSISFTTMRARLRGKKRYNNKEEISCVDKVISLDDLKSIIKQLDKY